MAWWDDIWTGLTNYFAQNNARLAKDAEQVEANRVATLDNLGLQQSTIQDVYAGAPVATGVTTANSEALGFNGTARKIGGFATVDELMNYDWSQGRLVWAGTTYNTRGQFLNDIGSVKATREYQELLANSTKTSMPVSLITPTTAPTATSQSTTPTAPKSDEPNIFELLGLYVVYRAAKKRKGVSR